MNGRTGTVSGGVLGLASEAEEKLIVAAKLLKSRATIKQFQGQNETHWDLFLEAGATPEDTIETCAISVGADALLRMGESANSEIIQGAARLVKRLRRNDGGWTSYFPSNGEESLTLEAYFAVRFLTRVDANGFHDIIDEAVQWLTNIENPATGGWGFFAGDTSKVLPTAYAVTALCASLKYRTKTIGVRDLVSRGVSWLLQRQNTHNGSWDHTTEGEGSAVQTAVVIRAILDSGLLRSHSQPIIQARNWLLTNLENRSSISDLYRVPTRGNDGRIIQDRRITHVTPPEAVILESLLLAGVDVLDQRLLKMAKLVIDNQRSDGSWPCPNIAQERPIFAIWEASNALLKFIEIVRRDEHILDIKEYAQHLNERLSQTERLLPTIEESIVTFKQRNKNLELSCATATSELAKAQRDLQTLENFRKGLIIFWPLTWITHFCRNYPIGAVWIFAVLAYVYFKYTSEKPYSKIDLPEIGMFAATAIVVGMETFHYYRHKKLI